MRKMLYATMLAAMAISVSAAELPKKKTTTRREVKGNPCAAYGAGYVRIEGTRTCVKIAGTVSVEAGSSR